MSYKKLEVWHLSMEVAVDIHKMTLSELPRFELFEEGSQIRRSSKAVASNIVEGYGRRMYKQDFLRFLHIALSSNMETINHLELLWETDSLTDKSMYDNLICQLNLLGKKLNLFQKSVNKGHISDK